MSPSLFQPTQEEDRWCHPALHARRAEPGEAGSMVPVGTATAKSWGEFMHVSPLFILFFYWVPLSVAGRNCKYSGEPEYWVEVRESGEKGQEKETKKQRKEVSQDQISVEHVVNCCIFLTITKLTPGSNSHQAAPLCKE